MLAGSSLELDQAIRNLVGWNIATAAEAIGLASTNPAAVLAPALAAHGARPAAAELDWSAELRLISVRVEGLSPWDLGP
jgi:N-acetylglucosamine-6-phosphate deacetylase